MHTTGGAKETAALPRDHSVWISPSGLVTITGGKWTTYRKMAEDTINQAATVGGLSEQACRTNDLHLHGWISPVEKEPVAEPDHWQAYGADWATLRALVQARPELGEPVHPRLPYCAVEVIWAVRQEMALTVEDVLARRTRSLLLDARASVEAAPKVAELMAAELHQPPAWADAQVNAFRQVAQSYVLD